LSLLFCSAFWPGASNMYLVLSCLLTEPNRGSVFSLYGAHLCFRPTRPLP
jgi:hypothetical protein